MTAIMVGGWQFKRVKRGGFRSLIRSRGLDRPGYRAAIVQKGRDMQHSDHAQASQAPAAVAVDDELVNAVRILAGRLELKSLERLYILHTLAALNGSRRATVQRLGISERTLRNKLLQYRSTAAT